MLILGRAQQRVAWPRVKRTTVTQFGPNMAGAKPKTPVDKNKNMDSSSDGSPATPRKRGRPPLTGNVKVKKEESADSKANIFLDFPQNVKVGVQLMLLTKHCDVGFFYFFPFFYDYHQLIISFINRD